MARRGCDAVRPALGGFFRAGVVIAAFALLPAFAASAKPTPLAVTPGLDGPTPSGTASAYRATVVDARGVTCSYGYAVFGGLKYGPAFKHFDYTNPDAPKGGTYRYAMQQASFDTLSQFSLLGIFPLSLIYFHDTLMKQSLDEPASRYGLIADRVCYPKDLSWFEFHIDPRARWNDGVPITVDDVLFTVGRSKTTIGVGLRRVAQAVDRAERTGKQTVRIYLTQKNNPTLPTVVTDMQLLPKHFYETHDLTAASLVPPVNSAAYRIGHVSPGRWIEFDRVKDYWARDLPVNKGRHNFDVIRHDFYRDAQVANQAFLAGLEDAKVESSSSRWMSDDRLPAFRAGEVKRILLRYLQPAFYSGLVLNTRRPNLSSRAMRQALFLCYDFEWVNRVLLGGQHGRLRSSFPNSEFEAKGLPSAAELAMLAPFRAQLPPELFSRAVALPVGGSWANRRDNLREAAAVLRGAGYRIVNGRLVEPGSGKPVAFELMAYSAIMDRQVSLFIANARRLGITINFRSVDSAQLRELMHQYRYDLLLSSPMLATSPTPGVGLLQMWSAKAADTPLALNYPGVRDPVVDAMIAKVVVAKDHATVVTAMRALDRILQWGYYAIPFQHSYPAPVGQMPLTYWDRFGRPAIQPTYSFPSMTLDTWWIDPAKQARLKYWRAQ